MNDAKTPRKLRFIGLLWGLMGVYGVFVTLALVLRLTAGGTRLVIGGGALIIVRKMAGVI